MVLSILAVFILSPVLERREFSLDDYVLVPAYQRGGIEISAAKEQLNNNLPGKVAHITCGGYSAPDWDPPDCVGLVVVNGEQKTPYLIGKDRPILAMGPDNIAIFTGKGRSALDKFEKYKSLGSYIHAIEVDDKAIESDRRTKRSIVFIKGRVVTFVVLVNANQVDCSAFLKNEGIEYGNYIFLDGGRALDDGFSPCYLAVVSRP